MASDHTPARYVQLDSTKLRTLAHPLRMRLLGALRLSGPSTATALAARLGTNSGKTSYHLRQLAQVGLVAEDPGRGNERDRWWRAMHTGTAWHSVEFRQDPNDRAADDWLNLHLAQTHVRWLEDWVAERANWPTEWLAAADSSDYSVRLTPAQVAQLTTELHAVVQRYQESEAAPETPGAERVSVLLHSFPHPEPSL